MESDTKKLTDTTKLLRECDAGTDCNNISPMFLMGYVCNRYLNGQINTITVLAVIYLPQICYAILYYLLSKKQLY